MTGPLETTYSKYENHPWKFATARPKLGQARRWQNKKKKKTEKKIKQEAQGLCALPDKMEDNDHIKLDNIKS